MVPRRKRAALALALSAGAVALSVGAIGCRPSVSRADCERMIDRYVELSLGPPPRDLPPSGFHPWVERGLQRGRTQPEYETRVVQCTREMTRSRIQCAMRAHTQGEWEACAL